jgi:hypothetical protein
MSKKIFLGMMALSIIILIGLVKMPVGADESYGITTEGTILKKGTTSYMYGTHILVNADGVTLYALKSENLNLDDFIGKKRIVKGDLIKGYPIDGGPDYLNVKKVE